MKNKQYNRDSKGFTLIELIVVVLVIGIIAAVLTVSYRGVQTKARDASVLSDIDIMDGIQTSYGLSHKTAGKAYYSGNGYDADLGFKPSSGNVIDVVIDNDDYCIRGYNQNASKVTIYEPYTFFKESSKGVCARLSPSPQAVADSPIPDFTPVGVSGSWLRLNNLGKGGNPTGNGGWSRIISASGGSRLIAYGSFTGSLHVSTDSGTSWTTLSAAGSRFWSGIATSSDGTKLVASAWNQGPILTSSDSGTTWTQRDTGKYWSGLQSSSDGTKLAVIGYTSADGPSQKYIYTSTNSGVTWTQRASAGARWWNDLTMSADGTKLIANTSSGYIYTSSDSGATWTARTGAGSRSWGFIDISDDGTKAVTGEQHGNIFTSSDSGATWVAKPGTGSGYKGWRVAISPDGTKIVAADFRYSNDTEIYISSDFGTTWTAQSMTGAWSGVTITSSGIAYVTDTNDGGYLYSKVLP